MRMLLSQRWIWYGNHRNSDMICDAVNWDELPPNIDSASQVFKQSTPGKNTLGELKAWLAES